MEIYECKRTRNLIPIELKLDIVEEYSRRGVSTSELAKRYNISRSCITRWIRTYDQMRHYNQPNRTKMRTCVSSKYPEIENRLMVQLIEMKSKGEQITFTHVQAKALQIAQSIGQEKFQGSDNWIKGMMKRHGEELEYLMGSNYVRNRKRVKQHPVLNKDKTNV